MEPAVKELQGHGSDLGEVTSLLADNGYFNNANCSLADQARITTCIAVWREQHNLTLENRFSDCSSLPEGADSKTGTRQHLHTKIGKALYAACKSTVEQAFGIIKHVLGFRQFSLRGLERVTAEWDLVSLAWNLKWIHVLAK